MTDVSIETSVFLERLSVDWIYALICMKHEWVVNRRN